MARVFILRLVGRYPGAPKAFPSLAARTSARMSRAVGQAQLPQAAPTALDAAGTPCPCLFATSSHNSFWEIFTIYSNSGYLLQIGKCLVWGCGGSWEGRRGVRSMFFGLSEVRLGILSPCLWNLPGSPARLLGVL